jgi:hypothetical protein
MSKAETLAKAKATLAEVAGMLEEMRGHLATLSEEQVLWVPQDEDVWPILRAVTHCVNCEHRATVELNRAIDGEQTPETSANDTAIFAWNGPTPYALARMVDELREQVACVADRLELQHTSIEAVRYPRHPPRRLLAYVRRMHHHTTRHLAGIRKKVAVIPEGDWSPEVRAEYPDYARPGGERDVPET